MFISKKLQQFIDFILSQNIPKATQILYYLKYKYKKTILCNAQSNFSTKIISFAPKLNLEKKNNLNEIPNPKFFNYWKRKTYLN